MSTTELALMPVKDVEVMAKRVAASRLFNMDENQVFALMLLCQSRGLHPIEAVTRYDIIQGRPAMKADAMLAEFQRIGGSVAWHAENDNGEEQAATFSHPTLCPKGQKVRFTRKDAERAGLTGKDTWRKYPANMLRARVISNGLRMIAPGIVSGIYTLEEVQDFDAADRPIQATATVAEPAAPLPAPAAAVEEIEAFFDRAAAPNGGPRWSDTHTDADKVPTDSGEQKDANGDHLARGERRTWGSDLYALCRATNREWEEICKAYKITYHAIASQGATERRLCNWAIEQGRIGPDYLLGAKGREDRQKQVTFLAKWWEKYREEFVELARSLLAEVLNEAVESNGLTMDGEQDEPADAETVTAEGAEA